MGLFSANLLAELAKGLTGTPPETYPLLKLQAPGQTFLWTSKGFGSLTHGVAQERVLDWGGEFGPDIDPTSDSMASWDLTLTIADMGETAAERRQFAREFAKYRSSLRRSVATLYPFMSPNVADADTLAIPLLFVSADQVAPMTWAITLKPDDTIMQNGVMPKVPLAAYFPNVHGSAAGHYAPIVYGVHDSQAANGKGFIPCPYVDTVGFRYMLSQGRISALRSIYKNGALVSAGVSLSIVTIKGTVFSLADFTTDQGDAEITADVDGLTVNADGTGGLITNPVRQWTHAIVNYGYNDHRQGAYFANSTAPLDTTALDAAATFLDAIGPYEGSFYISGTEQQKLIDFTNKFLADHPLFGYWTPLSKIALGFIDHRPPATIYPTGASFVEADVDEEGDVGISVSYNADFVERENNVQYIRSESTGEYHASLKVADLSVQDDVSVSLQLDWAARRIE